MSRVLSALLMLGLACTIGLSTVSAVGAPKEGKKDGAKKARVCPKEAFAKKDKDGDKKLSKEEFVGTPKKEGAKEKLEAAFAKKDKDGDGFLSFEEFCPPKKEKKGKKEKK